ncbi:hypothetical protein [Sporosarcina sp. Te-1]|uniref:hypothetical protein n=1 Tax=Sporosarcina sp. Te-1 TaxID=2818390 RepID=UPI001A9DD945|nr:hypothetical protein [Sporosarcina sp. Te-1]QTD43562.1 hypothetical protein J3U78_03935 [Sporosarcina sp. Te-1]
METVFRSIAEEVKSFLQLGDLRATGSVCPFLVNFIWETVSGNFLSLYFRFIEDNIIG